MSKKGAKKPAMAATLEEIMRMLMEERAQRETAMERREQQVQQQMTTMHQHMESLLQVVNESTAKTKSQSHRTLDVKGRTYLDVKRHSIPWVSHGKI